MKYNRLSFLSVFVALGMLPLVGDAAIRVGNAARNNAQGYQQVNTQRYQSQNSGAQPQQQLVDLPINVADQQLAQQIQSGDTNVGITVEDLDSCSMIYPNGEFEWARPTIGMQAGSAPTCTSVVELRVMIPKDGLEYTVLARANLAAGDSFECNVSNFPMDLLYSDVETVSFPPDKQPEVEDVIAVMNEEQKQNAALKIIGGAVLGGLGGNVAGKNEVGKDGILGGGKDKIVSSVIGAVGGAGLMAASTYSGKVAGDMILSTGVNAAAGAFIGNMVTDGDAVMRIERCVIDGKEQKCLWGFVEKEEDGLGSKTRRIFVSVNSASSFMICDEEEGGLKNCKAGLVGSNPSIKGYEDKSIKNNAKNKEKKSIAEILNSGEWKSQENVVKYCLQGTEMTQNETGNVECDAEDKKSYQYIEVDGKVVEKRIPVMIYGVEDSAFGYTKKNWESTDNSKKPKVDQKNMVGRNGKGEPEELDEKYKSLDKFIPMYQDAEDGGVIELGNKARLKGTLTGAGIGGAAGAFTAYQGAQTEIDERYVTAVREYKDSLQKFYCGTGKRFLTFYNDTLVMPLPNQN